MRWGELQAASNRFARVLREHGVAKAAAAATTDTSFGTFKCGAILLSMSVLYLTQGIRHRVSDSGAKVLLTDAANVGRIRWSSTCSASRSSPPVADEHVRARGHSGRRPCAALLPPPACRQGHPGAPARARGVRLLPRRARRRVFTAWSTGCGTAPLFGPWRLGATQLVYQREGGFDPHKQLDTRKRHGATNVFTTPTAMRSMMSITDAGAATAAVPRRLQRRRAAQPGGDPRVPRAVRRHRARLLRATESYPLVANYRSSTCARGRWASPCR